MSRKGSVLSAQATGEERFRLFAKSVRPFYMERYDTRLTFLRDGAGAMTGLVAHAGGTDTEYRKVR